MKKMIGIVIMILSLLVLPTFAQTTPTTGIQPKRERFEWRQKLNVSNQLALIIGEMKLSNGMSYQSSKEQIRRAIKKSDTLTGDQIVFLKDQLALLRQVREQMDIQSKAIVEIRNRLRTMLVNKNTTAATSVLDELILAQQEKIRLLEKTNSIFSTIDDNLAP